jgi:hypothetical protein
MNSAYEIELMQELKDAVKTIINSIDYLEIPTMQDESEFFTNIMQASECMKAAMAIVANNLKGEK